MDRELEQMYQDNKNLLGTKNKLPYYCKNQVNTCSHIQYHFDMFH